MEQNEKMSKLTEYMNILTEYMKKNTRTKDMKGLILKKTKIEYRNNQSMHMIALEEVKKIYTK